MRDAEAGHGDTPAGTLVAVTGGPYGVEAAREEALALADTYDATAAALESLAGRDRADAGDGDLLGSAPLGPGTFAEVNRELERAHDQLRRVAGGWVETARAVRVAVRLLEVTDESVRAGMDRVDRGALALLGTLVAGPAVLPMTLLAGIANRDRLPDALATRPRLAERLANAGGPLLPWAVSALYGSEGRGRARRHVATAEELPAASRPRDLVGVVDRLAAVARLSAHRDSPHDGTVEVQTLADADGRRRHVVYLPGTDDLATLPWTQDEDARDMAANARELAGRTSAYRVGVLDAMRQAGIGEDEPVLLAGHSQGGMVAAVILGEGSGFRVTDVVTVGSPTAHVEEFPEGSGVLSLEHVGDVVPHGDGEPNRDSREQVTVRFDSPAEGIHGSHDHEAYRSGVLATQASDDPSVRAGVERVRRFLGDGDLATSTLWQVTREE